MKPCKELFCSRNDPLGEQPNCEQERKHAGQEGDGCDHVVDERPQGDEVDDDAGARSQHLFFLASSHHNPMANESVNNPFSSQNSFSSSSTSASGQKPTWLCSQPHVLPHTSPLAPLWHLPSPTVALNQPHCVCGTGFCSKPIFT